MIGVYIRPLRVSDAQISYKWRNIPEIWRFTGSKPDKLITHKQELEWINNVLKRKDEKRYAICVLGSNKYIGNVQLTQITNNTAEFHIFIGNRSYWGQGVGKMATSQMIELGFSQINLKSIYLTVNKENIAAIQVYRKIGFLVISESEKEVYMKIEKE